MEDDLVAWGRVLRIETIGRVTGRPARAVVGFVEREDGSLAIAAGSRRPAGAATSSGSLPAGSRSRIETWSAEARPLAGAAHAAAVRDLILRYGSPAEGLGEGPSFELHRREGDR